MADGPEGEKVFKEKVVLLGNSGVGKSSILTRYTKSDCPESTKPTTGASFQSKYEHTEKGVVKLEIWDTAGQERYRSLAPIYYRSAAAALIVYDITDTATLDGAKHWVTELQRTDSLIFLVGNKLDLEENKREVATAVTQMYADENKVQFIEASAWTGQNIPELFHQVAEAIVSRPPPEERKSQMKLREKKKAESTCCGG